MVRPRSREVEIAQSSTRAPSVWRALQCPCLPVLGDPDARWVAAPLKNTYQLVWGRKMLLAYLKGPRNCPRCGRSVWPLESCFPLRACYEVRQMHACSSWESNVQGSGHDRVPELQLPRTSEAQKTGVRAGLDRFLCRGWAWGCPCGPLLSVPCAWPVPWPLWQGGRWCSLWGSV